MTEIKRVPPGIPVGGQFATRQRTDADTSLTPPTGPRIIATVQREEWVNNNNFPVGEPVKFDVTDIIDEFTAEERDELRDADYESDCLWREAVLRGITPDWDGPFTVNVTESLADFDALISLEDSVDEFFAGSVKDLNADQARAIAALNGHFGQKPSVTVHNEDRADLIYAPADDFDGENTTRITIGGDGSFQSFGHGSDWADSDFDNDILGSVYTDLIREGAQNREGE